MQSKQSPPRITLAAALRDSSVWKSCQIPAMVFQQACRPMQQTRQEHLRLRVLNSLCPKWQVELAMLPLEGETRGLTTLRRTREKWSDACSLGNEFTPATATANATATASDTDTAPDSAAPAPATAATTQTITATTATTATTRTTTTRITAMTTTNRKKGYCSTAAPFRHVSLPCQLA